MMGVEHTTLILKMLEGWIPSLTMMQALTGLLWGTEKMRTPTIRLVDQEIHQTFLKEASQEECQGKNQDRKLGVDTTIEQNNLTGVCGLENRVESNLWQLWLA